MGEEIRILSIHPCGTSRVILHAVKSYNMGAYVVKTIKFREKGGQEADSSLLFKGNFIAIKNVSLK
jgi:hypothetical protein